MNTNKLENKMYYSYIDKNNPETYNVFCMLGKDEKEKWYCIFNKNQTDAIIENIFDEITEINFDTKKTKEHTIFSIEPKLGTSGLITFGKFFELYTDAHNKQNPDKQISMTCFQDTKLYKYVDENKQKEIEKDFSVNTDKQMSLTR